MDATHSTGIEGGFIHCRFGILKPVQVRVRNCIYKILTYKNLTYQKGRFMGSPKGEYSLEILRGTLDLLILKTLSLGPMHGYDISKWVQWKTDDSIQIEHGALYQALRRLEKKSLLKAEWRKSATGREARFYELTREGHDRLAEQTHSWHRYVGAMSCVLQAVEVG